MWNASRRAQDRLNDYWNALVRRAPADELARLRAQIDPELSATIDSAIALHRRRRPDPAFSDRLEGELMNAFATTSAGTIPLPRIQPGPLNGKTEPRAAAKWLPPLPQSGARRWMVAQLAMAVLLIAVLIGAYFFVSGQGDQPAIAPPSTPEPTTTESWTNSRGDAARQGAAETGPLGQPLELWRFRADGPCNPSPAVVDGIVYAACNDGKLYALAAAGGDELWHFSADGALSAGPTVAGELAYIIDTNRALYAIALADGQEQWRLTGPMIGSPVVSDGLLAVANPNGELLGIDAVTGEERWRFRVADAGEVDVPAIAGGIVYAGSDVGRFVAVDAGSGELIWDADTGNQFTGAAVVADGIAYIGNGADTSDAVLHAFDAQTGASLWVRDEPLYAPAISNGNGYSGSTNGIVYAFDTEDGTELWRTQLGGTARPPAVADGVVYAPSDQEQTIYALDAATGTEIWTMKLDGGISEGVAIADGVLYVTTRSGSIYAIGGTGEAIPAPAGGSPAVGSPVSNTLTAQFVWQTTGGPEPIITYFVAVAPDGVIWANDSSKGGFQLFDSDGNYLEAWAPAGVAADAGLQVAFDTDGNIYVIDSQHVRKYDRDRTLLTSWGGEGTGDGQFQSASGIGVDAVGNVYVCDEFRSDVQKFDADGTFLAKWGTYGRGTGQLDGAGFMDVDLEGNSYVVDRNNRRVQKFAPDGTFLQTFGDGRLQNPNDVAIDEAGNLFVSEFGLGIVEVFDANGQYLGSWGTFGSAEGELLSGDAVALGNGGDVYVADNGFSRIVKFEVVLPPTTEATPTG